MRMREVALALILTIAGFSIGWIAVNRDGVVTKSEALPDSPSQRSTVRLSVTEVADSMVKWRLDAKQPGFNPLTAKLADWTDEEIIDALNVSLTNPEVMLLGGAGSGLATQLWGEWMRRDFDASIAWFEALDSVAVQTAVIGDIQRFWPPDKLEEGMQFALRHATADSQFDLIFGKAMIERVGEGGEAVTSLLEMMKEKKMNFHVDGKLTFPADFDFGKLAASEDFQTFWDQGGSYEFIRGWSENHRDEAFDWLLGKHGMNGLSMILMDRNPEGMEWMRERFSAIAPSVINEYVDHKRLGWLGSPGDLVRFSSGVEDPDVISRLRTLGVKSIYGGNTHTIMPMLEDMDDTEARIQLLESTPGPTTEERVYLGRPFNEVDEAFLREKLTAWQASPERIDAIITRFKTKP